MAETFRGEGTERSASRKGEIGVSRVVKEDLGKTH